MPKQFRIPQLKNKVVVCKDKTGIFSGNTIFCSCCNLEFSPSKWERHTGSTRHRPWQSITLQETGKNLLYYKDLYDPPKRVWANTQSGVSQQGSLVRERSPSTLSAETTSSHHLHRQHVAASSFEFSRSPTNGMPFLPHGALHTNMAAQSSLAAPCGFARLGSSTGAPLPNSNFTGLANFSLPPLSNTSSPLSSLEDLPSLFRSDRTLLTHIRNASASTSSSFSSSPGSTSNSPSFSSTWEKSVLAPSVQTSKPEEPVLAPIKRVKIESESPSSPFSSADEGESEEESCAHILLSLAGKL